MIKFSRKNKSRKHKLRKSRKHVGGLGSDTDEAIEKLFDSAIEESKEARRREEAIEPSIIIPAKRVTISCGIYGRIDRDDKPIPVVNFNRGNFPNGIGIGSRVLYCHSSSGIKAGPHIGAIVEAIGITYNGNVSVTFSGPFSYGIEGQQGVDIIFETEINA